MIRNLKNLGAAFCAALVLAAVGASAASAFGEYTASSYPTTGTGESVRGQNNFTTEAGNVECHGHFEGSLAAASTSLTVKANYSECKAFGFLEAKVSIGSCDYLFTAPNPSEGNWAAPVDISCTSTLEPITVTAATCKLTIGKQSPSGSVLIINYLTDLGLVFGVTGIKYTVVTDGFGCPFGGTGEKTGATYKTGATMTFDSTNGETLEVG